MSDIRARLADALQEHTHDFDPNGHMNGTIPGRGTHDCWCGEVFSTRDEQADHVADVLLSLPGIAIVELPEASGPWIVDGSLIYVTSSGAVEMRMPNYADAVKTRSLAAALLAAAVQAQEEQL